MSTKGRILLVAKQPSLFTEAVNELHASGFKITATSISKEIVMQKNRGNFQNILLSMDLVEDSFLEHLEKVETFLGAPCTLFSESTQSAARLLKVNHKWKIYGKVDASSIEKTYMQARLRYDVASHLNSVNTKTGNHWLDIQNSAIKTLDLFLGPNSTIEGGDSWKSLEWLTIQPLTHANENGYLIVGTDQTNRRDLSKKIISQWLRSFENQNSGFIVPFLETDTRAIRTNGLEFNPFFLVKSNSVLKTGTGFISESKPLPNPLRSDGGYAAFDIKCLIPNAQLPFDVFIYLPHNRKYLKLAKAGSLLTPEKYQQIVEVGHGEFHILEEQKLSFLQQATILNLQNSMYKRKAS